MALEDGRFLVSPERYDQLLADAAGSEHIAAASLVRVHPNFRVIAIGLPVPKFVGFALDPPLRSRFQARVVGAFSSDRVLAAAQHAWGPVAANQSGTVTKLLTMAHTLRALEDANDASHGAGGGLHVSEWAISGVIAHLCAFPAARIPALVRRYCPYHLVPGLTDAPDENDKQGIGKHEVDNNQRVASSHMEKALRRFGLAEGVRDGGQGGSGQAAYRLVSVSHAAVPSEPSTLHFKRYDGTEEDRAHIEIPTFIGHASKGTDTGGAEELLSPGLRGEACGRPVVVTDGIAELVSDMAQVDEIRLPTCQLQMNCGS